MPREVFRKVRAVPLAAGAAPVDGLGELPPYGLPAGLAADGLQAASAKAAPTAAKANRGRTVLRRRLVVRRSDGCMSVPFVGPLRRRRRAQIQADEDERPSHGSSESAPIR